MAFRFSKKMTRKQKAKQAIRPLANANLLSAASLGREPARTRRI